MHLAHKGHWDTGWIHSPVGYLHASVTRMEYTFTGSCDFWIGKKIPLESVMHLDMGWIGLCVG